MTLPATYSKEKPKSIPLNKVYVHAGHEKIYFGRGGQVVRGGLVRITTPDLGPQRDPTERLDWVLAQAADFKPYLFNAPLRLCLDENGEYDDLDGGGRAFIAHVLGHPAVEAFVSVGLSTKERATQFREAAHSTVPLGAVQDFMTYAAEGSPRHIAILNALRPYYTVKKSGRNAINSVAALYAVYDYVEGAPEDKNGDNYKGVALLQRTALECHTAWAATEERKGENVPGNLFVAVALIMQILSSAPYDEGKLRRWLTSHTPSAINEAAVMDIQGLAMLSAKTPKAAAKMLSLDKAVPMANVIARAYNKGLKGDFARIDLTDIYLSDIADHYAKDRQSKHQRP